MDGSSRKGLSPLLAIIIGLIVTIVAGILLAQLYFSYAATISARPAANIEYVDAVSSGTTATLVINLKNTGNVPIANVGIAIMKAGSPKNCTSTSVTVEPGETIGLVCEDLDYSTGQVINGEVLVGFKDGSVQVYAISVRVRAA